MNSAVLESRDVLDPSDVGSAVTVIDSDIHPDADRTKHLFAVSFSHAVRALKNLIIASPGYNAYVIHTEVLDRIATIPPDQQTVASLEAALKLLHILKEELQLHPEWQSNGKIAQEMMYLKGFLEGRLFEKMTTLERISKLRGYIWVMANALLDDLGIPRSLRSH